VNCKDFEELLSAYADGELSRTQKEFIEERLSGCADCRATLAQYEAVGRKAVFTEGNAGNFGYTGNHTVQNQDIQSIA
jgi:predicted anti-sigma-YlaC factor YlaD